MSSHSSPEMALSDDLTCIYSAFILQYDEVMVREDQINALIKAAGVNVEPFWPGLVAKVLFNVNIAILIYNVGVSGPGSAPAAGGTAPAGGAAPANTAAPTEEKNEEAKKEESEELGDDMSFGLFD